MKKIPTIFQRNYETDHLVRNEVTKGCEWVISGEGVATRKLDGTCCLVRDMKLYKRYELKKDMKPPDGFEPADMVDSITGKQSGWIPVGHGPEDQYHREALCKIESNNLRDGTYELIGPKIQGNPEEVPNHLLVRHDLHLALSDPPNPYFYDIRSYLISHNIEGIVWHHPDGRMAKIKARDFGIKRIGLAMGEAK